jgi:RNA polymerase sigma-70 factor (ECF subfamily)
MPDTPEVLDLLDAARHGDKPAIERLLSIHAPTVARYAARLCHDPADAEDVAQEALIAATRALPTFRGDAAFSTWLYAVTRTFCIRQRRRGRSVRRADVSLDAAEGHAIAEGAEPRAGMDTAMADRQLAQVVQSAVDELALPYREVLHLRDVEGLTAPEVSKILGLQVETVKTRLHRARAQVRARIAPLLRSDEPVPETARGDCPDIVRMFSKHLEGDISADTCAKMDEHLAHCPRCTNECDGLRRTIALCKLAPGLTVPVGTQALVRSALRRVAGRTE